MDRHRQLSPQKMIEKLQLRNAQLEARLARYQEYDQQFYRYLFESMDEGICIIEFLEGADGQLVDYVHNVVNPAFLQHTGLDNVVGRRVSELLPDEAEHWVDRFAAVLRDGTPCQFEQELPGTGAMLSVSSFRIEPCQRRQVAILVKDVTHRRQTEALLQQYNDHLKQQVQAAITERQLFARLVDHSAANVHVLDTQLRWLAVNQQAKVDFEYLYGARPAVSLAMPSLMSSIPEDRDMVVALWQKALTEEPFILNQVFGREPRQRHYELRFNSIRDENANVVGAFVFGYDITARVADQKRLQQAEAALRQAQKMEAVGQLTGGIAHDFNNLLGGILGAMELMQERLRQGRFDTLGSLLELSNNSALTASAVVHRLLAFSRRQTLQPRPTKICELLEGMEGLIRGSLAPGISLCILFSDALWSAFIDPPQLESAMLNLCLNARDALPSGGVITLYGENISLSKAQAEALELSAGDYLRVGVKDNGTGMTAEVAARAVEPFFTTKPIGQGSGLGLSMVYGFVQQSGGQLHIRSKIGQGSHIELYLPRYLCTQTTPDTSIAAVPAVALARRRIIVVEDQMSMRRVITELLEDLGHEVQAFDNGNEVINHLYHQPRPDLLITDIGLPHGVDGRQLAEQAQALHPELKVLLVTGYDFFVGLDHHLPPGTRLLSKPFSLELLAEHVTQLLHT